MKDEPREEPSPSESPTMTRPGSETPRPTRESAASLATGQAWGRFRVLRLLGRGGMGEVYEAEEPETGRRVALKLLSQRALSQSEHSRFLREGRLAASLNHPHCVYIYGTEVIEDRPVIVMELVTRGTLRDLVLRRGPLPHREAVDAIVQVIAGLESAERAGILHRDIKPSNCFVDARRRVKIGDFGLSISTRGSASETQLTASGTILGTPAFASPEQLQSAPLDVRSDIYSVGATLYYLLTGRPPLDAPTDVALVAAILQRDPAPPSRAASTVPRDLDRIVLRCLSKRSASRPATYAELREALTPFGSSRPLPAEPFQRLAGGLVDWLLLFVVQFPIATALFFVAPGSFVVMPFAAAAVQIAYFAVPEWRWGATVGKLVAGTRVVDAEGRRPGWVRCWLRALVFSGVPVLPALTMVVLARDLERYLTLAAGMTGQFLSWSGVLLGALLFVTVRRRNGWAGIHELSSGTRVARRPSSAARPPVTDSVVTAPRPSDAPAQVGPYAVLGALAGGSTLVGRDEALDRRVWIRWSVPGTPPVPPLRRDLDRPGRLRWINGRRRGSECWDVYEAPDGLPLSALAATPRGWGEVRGWLLDLADEIDGALEDGTLPDAAGPEQVWIGADGAARLLEFPTDIAGAPASAAGGPIGSGFLTRVARLAMLGPETGNPSASWPPESPLPVHARAFLEELAGGTLDGPGAAAWRLRRLAGEPLTVSRSRRVAHLACAHGLFALMLLLSVGSVLLGVSPPSRSAAREFAALRYCLDRLRPADPTAPAPGEVLEADAVERYVAARFGHLAALFPRKEALPEPADALPRMTVTLPDGSGSDAVLATALGRQGFLRAYVLALDEKRRRQLLDVIARRGVLPVDSVQEAEQALGQVFLDGLAEAVERETGRFTAKRVAGFAVLVEMVLIVLWSLWTLAVSTLFRGGPLLYLFGIAVITRTGGLAGRFRHFRRVFPAALASLMLAVASFALFIPRLRADAPPSAIPWVAIALLALAPAIGLVWCAVDPARGPHDRLAATRLVPR